MVTAPLAGVHSTYRHAEENAELVGWIEIGQDEMNWSFIRALDEDGLVWEGQEAYATLDDALQDLEAGLAVWMRKQHL